MVAKISYVAVSLASLGLLLFEAPRGSLLTGKPDRGKVEQKQSPNPAAGGRTVRSAYFVFIGGYHGGK